VTPVLPGTIPGLLRRGSPVIALVDHAESGTFAAEGGVATYAALPMFPGRPPHVTVHWHDNGGGWHMPWDAVALDLTDPTGRTHAAWWLAKQNEDDVDVAIVDHLLGGAMPADGFDVTRHRWLAFWSSGAPATDTQIDALRRIVLQVLAEVTP
jgi:hypothetical protein